MQLDGSIHEWFIGTGEKQCLMNLVDDATGKTLGLLSKGETTEAALRILKWWITLHGIPMAIYVDLKSLYISPKALRYSKEEELIEPEWLTHFSRACQGLGIEIIKAYSPQAKGRVERNHGVYQDRFVKELRLKGVRTLAGANEVLQNGFIDKLNSKFMKSPSSAEDAHIPLTKGQDLNELLCWMYTRTVSNDRVVRFENQYFQIEKTRGIQVNPKQKVILRKDLNGKISLWLGDKKIPHQIMAERPQRKEKPQRYYSPEARSYNARLNKNKTPWNRFNTNWLKKTKDSRATLLETS